jgi:hypothetical protein
VADERGRDASGRYTSGGAGAQAAAAVVKENTAKAQTASLAKYAKVPKAPPPKEEAKPPPSAKDVAKHLRENFMADGEPESGYAQGTTKEVAESIGIAPEAALKVLQKAAKAGLVQRRGHEKSFGKASAAAKGFGYQIWELPNRIKLED